MVEGVGVNGSSKGGIQEPVKTRGAKHFEAGDGGWEGRGWGTPGSGSGLPLHYVPPPLRALQRPHLEHPREQCREAKAVVPMQVGDEYGAPLQPAGVEP